MNNEITEFKSLTGIQKVAIFFVAIGKEASSILLRQLEDHEMELVAVQVAKLKNLPSIKDDAFVATHQAELDQILAKQALADEVYELVKNKL